ncbi:MAG: hypothetical protein ABSA72_01240 [Nitrososphaerales archaeon]
MEIAGLRVALEQLRDAIVVVYSAIVIATFIPGFASVSNLLILPYFIIVPGYLVTLILRNTGTLLETIFYTIAWSTAILLSVYSIQTIVPGSGALPITLVVPALTIVLLAYIHFHKPTDGA